MFRHSEDSEPAPESESTSAWLGKRFPRLTPGVLAVAIFTTLTLALLLYIFDLFPGNSCNTVEQCVANADQMASGGKFAPALESLDMAMEMAEGQPGAAYAYLWCRRGDILRLSGDPRAALEDYRTCKEWIGNEAGYEQVRDYADSWIEQLE